MDVSTNQHWSKRKPRKFKEKWALHPQCETITQEVWNQEDISGSPMFFLWEKIKNCQEALFGWYEEISREFHRKVKDHTNMLMTPICTNDSGQHNSAIATTKAKINKLLLDKELH